MHSNDFLNKSLLDHPRLDDEARNNEICVMCSEMNLGLIPQSALGCRNQSNPQPPPEPRLTLKGETNITHKTLQRYYESITRGPHLSQPRQAYFFSGPKNIIVVFLDLMQKLGTMNVPGTTNLSVCLLHRSALGMKPPTLDGILD